MAHLPEFMMVLHPCATEKFRAAITRENLLLSDITHGFQAELRVYLEFNGFKNGNKTHQYKCCIFDLIFVFSNPRSTSADGLRPDKSSWSDHGHSLAAAAVASNQIAQQDAASLATLPSFDLCDFRSCKFKFKPFYFINAKYSHVAPLI